MDEYDLWKEVNKNSGLFLETAKEEKEKPSWKKGNKYENKLFEAEKTESQRHAAMDDQTRMAHFESMRRNPGMRRGRSNKNKKLFMKHKELEKTCQREILRHQFDTKVVTTDLRREQRVFESKRQRLEKQKSRAQMQREKTHVELEQQEKKHDSRTYDVDPSFQSKLERKEDEELMKAIGKLQMPTSMKERLVRTQTLLNAIASD